MWPFKKKQESPEEIAAEKRLDEVTHELSWDEFDKEAGRETPTGPLARTLVIGGAMQGPLHEDPDPGGEHGLRDALHDDDQKTRRPVEP